MITKPANRYQHQLEAAAKVIQNGGVGGLHHDVGCGKTITVFDVFAYYKKREPDLRLLVIAPLNILGSQGWADKIKDWTDFNFYNCHAMQGTYQRDSEDIDIYLINYESLNSKKHKDRLPQLLSRFDFMGILDESHRAKNHQSITAKTINGYYAGGRWRRGIKEHFKYRMILTGTAAPNTPTEWYSQCLFLSEDIFGRRVTNFRCKYFYLERKTYSGEIETTEMVSGSKKDFKEKMDKGFKVAIIPQMRDEFYGKLSRYVHFVKSEDAIDLPDETDEIRPVIMSEQQERLYRRMERDLVIEFNEMEEVTAAYALTKIQKLIQIANGFVIDDARKVHVISEKKLDELSDLVDEMGDRQIIIWGHYIKEIELITKRLGDRAICMRGNDRDEVLKDFCSGKFKCLIANPASSSEGLDLQNACVEIFASLNYNLREYLQARGRIRRPGQKNKCLFLHMLAEGTIEEEIYLALRGKQSDQELAHAFIKRIKSTKKSSRLGQKKLLKSGGPEASRQVPQRTS